VLYSRTCVSAFTVGGATLARPMLALCLVWVGCTDPAKAAPSPMSETLPPSEIDLRHWLGIPDDAARVLILSQSSHLDYSWQLTFEGYYRRFVDSILTQAQSWLASDPQAHYSIAEMSELERYASHHGNGGLARRAAEGRLHVVGGALGTPDTLL